MNFLIQTFNGEIKHDFSFTLIDSIRFQNWLRNSKDFNYILTDGLMIPNCIPIGSVEFVSKYITYYYGITLKPKNIPSELMNKIWTGRNVINGTEKNIIYEKFVKSNDKIKSFTKICKSAPKGNYQISDIIEIESEWRAFVFEGKLVGLQNYAGKFDIFPNINKINSMIKAYKSQTIAFTLDIAISNKETVVIEIHDFFSCGLYGFSDYKILPFMFSRWFFNFIKNR